MNQKKLSEFIYTLDLESRNKHFGVWDFKTFYSRKEAMEFAESFARNNPEFSVAISIHPRFWKKNVLAR